MPHHISEKRIYNLFECQKSPPLPYRCEKCDFSTHFLIKLNNHIQTNHKYSQSIELEFELRKCPNCTFQSYSYFSFILHTYNCQQMSKMRKKIKKWHQCEQCPYKSRQKSCLTNHVIARHTAFDDINWFKCAICGLYQAKTRGDLRKHIQRIHTRVGIDETKKFKCEKCPFMTRRKPCLRKHMIMMHLNSKESETMKIKTEDPVLSCTECSYKTRRSDNLKTHMREQHTDPGKIKWFECGECDYKAKRLNRLKEHKLMRHTDLEKIQWFECGHCQYKAKLKSNLKAHILTKHISLEEIRD